ncbi:MAG TPA: helix-turn-helix domain-containing protein [Solirubrobacteraceae bacterium]|nr:helix-turn-helix domain-containing protein [Solirubrobacteraceae bacterium]
MSATAPRTRADAVRNAERVLAAATEVVAEKGAEAGVPEIAARAGVGKGTVYRCFPTKEHLIGAVLVERLRWFTETAQAAAERPDAWEAFVDLLVDAAERQAGDCTFSAGLSHESVLPEVVAAREAMHEAMDALMARAQAAGRMREGVTSRDVKVLFAGTAQMLRADGNRDPAEWRRYAGLVANAVRA